MRILVAIPHFYASRAGAHGSEAPDAAKRIAALRTCIVRLHQTFGGALYLKRWQEPCNADGRNALKVVVCTTGPSHLVEHLPQGLFEHRSTDAEPKLLGYECHQVLKEELGNFDYYVFLEDDLALTDSLFFTKMAAFTRAAGEHALLQPNRYELSESGPVYKLYIDGPLVDSSLSRRFQDESVRPRLVITFLGREFAFERVDNPHSGCFFLTQNQMARWSEQPYFLDRSSDFYGPLESAATLGVMRTFEIYKAAPQDARFLEMEHMDLRYVGKRIRFAEGAESGQVSILKVQG